MSVVVGILLGIMLIAIISCAVAAMATVLLVLLTDN